MNTESYKKNTLYGKTVAAMAVLALCGDIMDSVYAQSKLFQHATPTACCMALPF